jgi:phospholipase/carboxylesterase
MYSTRVITDTIRPAEGFYVSAVESPRRLPVLTFLPGGYEPNYAYPLVVFFHGQGSSEQQILRLAPRLSRRNYICLALRGPHVAMRHNDGSLGYAWDEGTRAEAFAEEYVFQAIDQITQTYNIHSQRIFLAGFCEGGAQAYRLGLAYPTKFAGIIAMNGQMPANAPLLRWPEARRLRVLMGHGIANSVIPLTSARSTHRLLYTAGLDVQFQTYPTNHRIHLDMLRDMNRWIMKGVGGLW